MRRKCELTRRSSLAWRGFCFSYPRASSLLVEADAIMCDEMPARLRSYKPTVARVWEIDTRLMAGWGAHELQH